MRGWPYTIYLEYVMSKAMMILVTLMALLALSSCGGSGAVAEDGDLDNTGKLGGDCRANGSCNEGLTCIENVCKYPTDDGDIDIPVDGDPEEEDFICYRDTQCPPNHSCIIGECIADPIDGDAVSDGDTETEGGEGDTEVPDGPKLDFEPESIDFGSVQVDQSSERILTLRNLGVADLVFTEIAVRDGVTDEGTFELIAEVDEFTLTPGESIGISLRFSRIEVGAAEAFLRIESNDIVSGGTLDLRLYSIGSEAVKLVTLPEELDFGLVPLNKQANLSLEIQNALLGDDIGDLIISRLEIQAGASHFFLGDGLPSLPKSLGPGISSNIPIIAFPQEAGALEGSLAIYHNDPAKAYPLLVPLTMISVVPELAVEPAMVEFGPVPIGEQREVLLTLRNKGGDDAEIESISFSELSSEAFSIALDPDDDGLGTLPGTITAGSFATISLIYNPQVFGEHEAALYIRSNDYSGEPTVIAVTGQAIPPSLSITPGIADYGCVQVGKEELRLVTIELQGSGEVTIGNIYVESSHVFEITSVLPSMPTQLTGGDTLEVEVGYHPMAQMEIESGTLVIVIGEGDTINFEVELTGCGIASSIAMDFDNNNAFMDVQVLPGDIPALGEMTPDQEALWVARSPVILTNSGQAPLHISSIAPAETSAAIWGADASQPTVIQPQESTQFDVLFAPRLRTNYIGRIHICSDAIDASGSSEDCEEPGHVSHTLEIHRTPIELFIFVEPTSGRIDFPQPQPGEFETAAVIIHNNGSNDMHISAITLAGQVDAYFIDGIEPAAGDEGWILSNNITDFITVPLRFEPEDAGSKTASLLISHNDKDAAVGNGAPSSAYPEYPILLVGNGLGNTPPYAIIKSPAGQPPEPTIGARRIDVEPTDLVFLDGTSSYDIDDGDAIISYAWTIEEESGFTWISPTNNASATISFDTPGQYTINLEVADSHGGISVPTQDSRLEVAVQVDPVAVATELGTGLDSLTARVGVAVKLDGTASTDGDGTIAVYRWSVREHPDGAQTPFSTEAQPTYTFEDLGYFDILLEVEDNDGRVSKEQDEIVVNVLGNDRIRIEALWTNGGNIDIHYIKPGGSFGTPGDCNTDNRTPDWELYGMPQFIRSSDTGSLPEIILHNDPADGIYTVRAQYVEASEACGNVEHCDHFEKNCGVCGCDCWEPLCWINWDICCKSCDECVTEWVCEDNPAAVTFYLYLNGEAQPTWVLDGNSYTVQEEDGNIQFSLHRVNGLYQDL